MQYDPLVWLPLIVPLGGRGEGSPARKTWKPTHTTQYSALLPTCFGEGSPTKIDYKQKTGTLVLPPLDDLVT